VSQPRATKKQPNGLISLLLLKFHLHQLLPNLTIGFVSGAIGVTISISFAALIFSGELANYRTIGIGTVLFSSVIIRAAVGLLSSFPGIIADVDERGAVILALMAATIADRMAASATSEEILLTVLVAIALTTALTGAFLLALGMLKVGELIRFIPYPVVGGFIVGTGWLLVQGAINVMTDQGFQMSQLPGLFQYDVLIRWFPGLVFAIFLLLISRRIDHVLLLPLSFIGAIGIFYGFLGLTNTSIASVSDQGWLLGPFSAAAKWQPLQLSALVHSNWSVILQDLGSIISIIVISAISILLTASGIELLAERDIDLNQELRATGIANLIASLGGGMVGCQVLTDSVLAYKMGARSRAVGIFSAIFCAIVLLVGTSFLSYFPKPVVGGLLLFLGLSFLAEWVYDAWFKLPKSDYGIVLLILVVVAAVGFLEGVAVGLFVAVVLFVINYSQISIAKHIYSATAYQSRVSRPPHQWELLRQKGSQVYILELQGFIFFGTANRLLNQIRQRLSNHQTNDQVGIQIGDQTNNNLVSNDHLEPLKFLVLDFHLVNGLDSSAVLSFVKLKQLAYKAGITLVFTELDAEITKLLQQAGCLKPDDPICQVFPDLDRGVEWCETQILGTVPWRRSRFLPLSLQLQRFFSDPEQVSNFMPYLEKVSVPVGEFLFRQGAAPDALYFVESGQVSTLLELNENQTLRLQTLGAGTIVGEIAFHRQAPYRASAIADQPTTVYRLTHTALQTMRQNNPQTAAVYQEFLLSLLADRLSQAYEEIESLRS
jgi:sulfate permease, SulP family